MSLLGQKLFEGEIALVTGAASNIGRAVAVRLAGEGAQLVLTDVDDGRLKAVAAEIAESGGTARSIVADLSVKDGWHTVRDSVADTPPAIFVHSACPKRHEVDTALNVSEETFDAMLTTNLRSGFMLGRDVARNMVRDKLAGRLLFMTSLHAFTPRNLPHYSASKAGMTMMMKELARDLGPAGIRVNGIAPGAIPGGGFATSDDEFQPKRKIPMGRFGEADDIARAAVGLLCNELNGYVTGTTLDVDGGLQLFNWIDFPQN